MYENARKYNLTGTDAMVFEALVYLCRKDGKVSISYGKLATFSCCGGKTTAFRSVKHLSELGLVFQNETGAFQIETQSFQNETISKEERTKEENIIKESGVVIDSTTHTTFFDFWTLFSPNGKYKRYEKACKKIWDTMPEDWRKLAIERRAALSVDRNPLFYLRDEDFLHEETHPPAEKTSPEWLNGYQQDEALAKRIPLAVCRNPETGLFATCTKDDAEKFKLNILRIM